MSYHLTYFFMSFFTRRLAPHDAQLVIPLLRQSNRFFSDQEAAQAFLHELSKGREFRGVHDGTNMLGLMGWEDRGLPKHGVVEVIRFAIPERKFVRSAAELLFDTSLASIDYYFRQQQQRLRKVFMVISNKRGHAKEFLEDRGLIREAMLKNHYHDNRNESVYSLFC